MKINFNYKIEEFIEFCKENSIEIYLVGGALRDYILDIPTFDYDFALTSDYSKAVEKLSKKYNFICNDKYQAIKLKLDEYSVEITHARVEQGIKDNRHPLNVEFIDDIKLDSKRRDFTINALY